MAHVFKKYTTNRGSALFMVLSTMTALLVSCMAMYFTMVSARSTQFAVFDQQQAHQTAQSVAEIVLNSINDPDSAAGTELREKMQEFDDLTDVGKSITTGSNGYTSLDPNKNGLAVDEDQLGGYMVTITYLGKDAAGNKQYDICAMSSVSDTKDVVHMKVTYNENQDEKSSSQMDEPFCATGYTGESIALNGAYYLTDMNFYNDFTYINAFHTGSGENRIGYNVLAGGNLEIGNNAMTVVKSATSGAIKPEDVAKIGPVEWVIKNDLKFTSNDVFDVRGGSNIFIGGDFIVKNGGFFNRNNSGYTGSEDVTKPICIYVLGDFNVGDGWLNLDNKKIHMYINGSLKKTGGGGVNGMNSAGITFYLTDPSKADSCFSNVQTWDSSAPDGLSYETAKEYIEGKTQPNENKKWDLKAIREDTKIPKTSVVISMNNNQPTYFLSFDENTQSATNYINSGTENGTIAQPNTYDTSNPKSKIRAFSIEDINVNVSESYIPRTIVIDTGEDENNVVFITVKPNYSSNTFMWFPYDSGSCTVGRNIIYKGRGTVIVDLQNSGSISDGVTYQESEAQFAIHEGWWKILGGEIKTNGSGHIMYDSDRLYQGTDSSSKVVPFIHHNCKPGDSEGCSYTFSESDIECQKHERKLTKVTCSTHGDVYYYCPECSPELEEKRTSGTEGWCENYINIKGLDNYYSTHADKKITDSSGNTIYPTTNYYLVSSDESIKFRFATAADGSAITKNAMFGNVYAPYISYALAGGNNTGFIKLFGSAMVATMDVQGTNSFFGVNADKLPLELVNSGVGIMTSSELAGSKTWKFDLDGYK